MPYKPMILTLILILSLLLGGMTTAAQAHPSTLDEAPMTESIVTGLDDRNTPKFTACTDGTIASSRISSSSDDAEKISASGK